MNRAEARIDTDRLAINIAYLKSSSKTDLMAVVKADAYGHGLKVMDMTAFTLCKENDLPIIVFDMDTPGNLKKLINGEQVGTIVRN